MHLDLSLITFLEAILLIFLLQSALFYNLGSIFLTAYFKHFVFMELFDLNSNLNNLIEISSIKNFLVDSSVSFLFASTIKFCILLIAAKKSNFPLSGLIHNQALFLLLFAFLLLYQYFCPHVLIHQSLLQVYALKNMHQFYRLKHYVVKVLSKLKILS